MRTGELWAITKHGVAPDILVTGKGMSGGMYPVTVVLATERAAAWMEADGFAHMATFGGAEVGCIAALRCLEITTRPEVRALSHHIAGFFTAGLDQIRAKYPDWFTGVRQDGLVMGLEFAHPEGAKFVMRRLYAHGVWAIFATLDPRVLQYKAGLLLTGRPARRSWRRPRRPSARPAMKHFSRETPPGTRASQEAPRVPNGPDNAPLEALPSFAADEASRAVLRDRLAGWAQSGEAPYPVASNARAESAPERAGGTA